MRVEEAWAQLHAAADLAAARGSLIFHIDLATEVALAALVQNGIEADQIAVMVGEDGYRVFAFDAAADPKALTEVRFTADGSALTLPAPQRLPPRTLVIARARATIGAAYPGYAAIAIPASHTRAEIEGYALAVGDAPDVARLGDHRLLKLDPAGRDIRSDVALSAGRDMLPAHRLRKAALAEAGAVPHEIHTYLSLKHGVPLFVHAAESGVTWRIDGERTTALPSIASPTS